MKKCLSVLLFSVIFLFALSAELRTALVIGNAAYRSASLRNPANDARDMSAALQNLGFSVTTLIDADNQKMYQAIRDFGKDLARCGMGLFYYAGHGMQVDGTNYLIPIGANIQAEDEVRFNSIDANFRQIEGPISRYLGPVLAFCRRFLDCNLSYGAMPNL